MKYPGQEAVVGEEPLVVPVYYDFSSTLCYVADRIMERMAPDLDEIGVELLWTPIDLTEITSWQRGDRMAEDGLDNVLRVARELAVPLQPPGYWMDSRLAMAVANGLSDDPEAESRFRTELWRWVYGLGRSLDEPGAMEELAALSGTELPEAGPGPGLERLAESTRQAIAIGVQGVPTFLLDVWPIGGIQEPATMRSLLGRWAGRKRDGTAAN